jgi:hypothetical protein
MRRPQHWRRPQDVPGLVSQAYRSRAVMPPVSPSLNTLSGKWLQLPARRLFANPAGWSRSVGGDSVGGIIAAAFARERNGGLIVVVSSAATVHRDLIISLAAKHLQHHLYCGPNSRLRFAGSNISTPPMAIDL